MTCEYCEGKSRLIGGNPEVIISHDDYYGYCLKAVSKQEDRWYGDIEDEEPINFCPMCGRDL